MQVARIWTFTFDHCKVDWMSANTILTPNVSPGLGEPSPWASTLRYFLRSQIGKKPYHTDDACCTNNHRIICTAVQIKPTNIISLGMDSPTLCPKGPTSEKTKGKRRRRCRVGAFILLVKVELPSTDYYCLVFNGIRFHRVLSFKELLKKVREKKKHSIDKSPVVSSRCQCFFSDMMLGMTFCFLDFI